MSRTNDEFAADVIVISREVQLLENEIGVIDAEQKAERDALLAKQAAALKSLRDRHAGAVGRLNVAKERVLKTVTPKEPRRVYVKDGQALIVEHASKELVLMEVSKC